MLAGELQTWGAEKLQEQKAKSGVFPRVCVRCRIRTEGGGVALLVVGLRLGRVQELLVAHVALAAAEEDVGTLLRLHALVTAEDTAIVSSTDAWNETGDSSF